MSRPSWPSAPNISSVIDELFDTAIDCDPHHSQHEELLLRSVTNIRRRVAEEDAFCSPAHCFNEELESCLYVSAKTWEKVFGEDSWLAQLSLEDYNALRSGVELLETLWVACRFLNRPLVEHLLGTIALHDEYAVAYARCEELTHEERNPPYRLHLLDDPADGRALETIREFERILGNRSFVGNPFFVSPGESNQAKPLDVTADRLSHELWHLHASRPASEVLGALLLEEDYGRAHLRELARYV